MHHLTQLMNILIDKNLEKNVLGLIIVQTCRALTCNNYIALTVKMSLHFLFLSTSTNHYLRAIYFHCVYEKNGV